MALSNLITLNTMSFNNINILNIKYFTLPQLVIISGLYVAHSQCILCSVLFNIIFIVVLSGYITLLYLKKSILIFIITTFLRYRS